MPTPQHSVSAAGIVLDASGTRILLIHRRDNGRWEPPGGVLELGETIEDAVIREVEEETGAQVEVERLTGVYKNMRQGIVALVFRCRLLSDPVSQTDEARNVAWMEIDDVPSLMKPAYAARVLDALGDDVHVRAHDGVDLLPDSAISPIHRAHG
ncbi:NUDIX hydrolase [Cellulomonas chitinilytica]|uniref:NUDIX hydrolase n=1 Tax=Cellulomonas chitinilytica TaxID=398759 RepID=A0A919TZ31_9CELL|nr:NUDIX domain-containing protein [Cellulomonas chitinilytica]GIG21260.1 NUDIX hydrolase [Cellulomonas chitinilytica]